MSAISIGPEYYWNEANYSWNVTVADNLFSQNALCNNLNADGVIFVHGDGAMGNRNITIIRNRFEDNYSPNMMNIAWAGGVKITDNTINTPAPLPLSEPGHIINLHDVHNVTLKGNIYSQPGPSVIQAVGLGKDVTGIIGNDDFGIRKVIK